MVTGSIANMPIFGMPRRALGTQNFKTDSVVLAWRGVVPLCEMVQVGFLRLYSSHLKIFLQKLSRPGDHVGRVG